MTLEYLLSVKLAKPEYFLIERANMRGSTPRCTYILDAHIRVHADIF
jgi:hypothetical protein